MEFEEFKVGYERVIVAQVPEYEDWVPALLFQMRTNESKFENSHKINNRWENSYLEIDLVPEVRTPMRFARDLGMQVLGIRSVILFEPPNRSAHPYPPFWFNIAGPKQSTGLHDHTQAAALSAVSYLQAEKNCGNLYFCSEKQEELEIEPTVGSVVLFPPQLRHGVRDNLSEEDRVSLAFNLHSFPLREDYL